MPLSAALGALGSLPEIAISSATAVIITVLFLRFLREERCERRAVVKMCHDWHAEHEHRTSELIRDTQARLDRNSRALEDYNRQSALDAVNRSST